MKQLLIIAEPSDSAALWLNRVLGTMLPGQVRLLTPGQLFYAPRQTQRKSDSIDQIEFDLHNQQQVHSDRLRGVINRVLQLPDRHLSQVAQGDRDYATGEMHAFALGWLACLPCPVLNPPTPGSLCGAHHPELVAMHLAALAGLPPLADEERLDAPEGVDDHIVLDSAILGADLPQHEAQAIQTLAQLWGARLLQVQTRLLKGQRFFHGATPLVNYPFGGTALAHAIVKVCTP